MDIYSNDGPNSQGEQNRNNQMSEMMKYLEEHEYITVSVYGEVAGIAPKTASRTLVLLVLANVLKVMADEKADRFSLNKLEYD